MRKISTIISVLLMATVAASGAISTQVATVGLEGTQEAPKNNGNTKGIIGPPPKSSNSGTQGIIGPPPVSSGGGVQGTIGPSPSGSSGNQSSQCYTDWGYNRCTDILDLGGMLRFDLSRECVPPYLEHAIELEGFARGEYIILSIEGTASSYMAWIIIICGEGNFVYTGTGMTDVDMSANDGLVMISFAKDVVDVTKGVSPATSVLTSFLEAVVAEDHRFDDHDGDGIQNYEDADYDGPMSSGDNIIVKSLRDLASDWLDDNRLVWDEETKEWVQTGPEDTEDEDEDEDDEDGDEEGEDDDPSLTDDPGCPEDSPAFC